MKKYFSIFLLSVLLLSSSEVRQLFKLPVLMEHYFGHKAELEDLSFLEFLSIHYLNGIVVDADYAEDMKLPFKTYSPNTITIYPLLEFTLVSSFNFFFVKKEYQTSYLVSQYSSDYLPNIWQPPQFL